MAEDCGCGDSVKKPNPVIDGAKAKVFVSKIKSKTDAKEDAVKQNKARQAAIKRRIHPSLLKKD